MLLTVNFRETFLRVTKKSKGKEGEGERDGRNKSGDDNRTSLKIRIYEEKRKKKKRKKKKLSLTTFDPLCSSPSSFSPSIHPPLNFVHAHLHQCASFYLRFCNLIERETSDPIVCWVRISTLGKQNHLRIGKKKKSSYLRKSISGFVSFVVLSFLIINFKPIYTDKTREARSYMLV